MWAAHTLVRQPHVHNLARSWHRSQPRCAGRHTPRRRGALERLARLAIVTTEIRRELDKITFGHRRAAAAGAPPGGAARAARGIPGRSMVMRARDVWHVVM